MCFNKILLADLPVAGQMGLQDPATPVMEGIISLHHHIFFYLIVIFFIVFWNMFYILIHFSKIGLDFLSFYKFYRLELTLKEKVLSFLMAIKVFLTLKIQIIGGYKVFLAFNSKKIEFLKFFSISKNLLHNTVLEIVWTIIPAIILILIALPSFALIYSVDEIVDPDITVKIIGHQWYWSYEMFLDLNFGNNQELSREINFDSYLIPEENLTSGSVRLLFTDNLLLLPSKQHIRLIITSSDVLHAWSVPSLGVKVDAVPGRLNQASIFFKRNGVFFGQCSELCGVGHGFMPIIVKAIALQDFLKNVLVSTDLENLFSNDLIN
jgi:cytochrome c oxidase subunit 2